MLIFHAVVFIFMKIHWNHFEYLFTIQQQKSFKYINIYINASTHSTKLFDINTVVNTHRSCI